MNTSQLAHLCTPDCSAAVSAAILHQYPEHIQGHEFRHIYYPLSIFDVDTVCHEMVDGR